MPWLLIRVDLVCISTGHRHPQPPPKSFLHDISVPTMPPRGNEGLDFTPILTHYLFLFTSILAVVRFPAYTFKLTPLTLHSGWLVCSLHIPGCCHRRTYVSLLFVLPLVYGSNRLHQSAMVMSASCGSPFFSNSSSSSASSTPSQAIR